MGVEIDTGEVVGLILGLVMRLTLERFRVNTMTMIKVGGYHWSGLD